MPPRTICGIRKGSEDGYEFGSHKLVLPRKSTIVPTRSSPLAIAVPRSVCSTFWAFHTWDRGEPEQGFGPVKKRISVERATGWLGNKTGRCIPLHLALLEDAYSRR